MTQNGLAITFYIKQLLSFAAYIPGGLLRSRNGGAEVGRSGRLMNLIGTFSRFPFFDCEYCYRTENAELSNALVTSLRRRTRSRVDGADTLQI